MDITDPNSPIFVIWAMGAIFTFIGTGIFTFVNLGMMFEYRSDANGYMAGYDGQTAKKYARSSLKTGSAMLFSWAWPVAMLVAVAWTSRVVFQLADVPTPLAMYRARKQAKIEELERQIEQRRVDEAERERYTDKLERQLGVGKYAA